MDIDAKTFTSEPAVDTKHLDWRQECQEKSMAEVLKSEDTVLIINLVAEFADDEQDAKKMTASEALTSLSIVKCFAEIHGDNQMNVILNELIWKVETKVLSEYYPYVF